jgi:hypothetical protein
MLSLGGAFVNVLVVLHSLKLSLRACGSMPTKGHPYMSPDPRTSDLSWNRD